MQMIWLLDLHLIRQKYSPLLQPLLLSLKCSDLIYPCFSSRLFIHSAHSHPGRNGSPGPRDLLALTSVSTMFDQSQFSYFIDRPLAIKDQEYLPTVWKCFAVHNNFLRYVRSVRSGKLNQILQIIICMLVVLYPVHTS